MKHIYLAIFSLFGAYSLQAQNSKSEQLWVNYMLEPNPNYYKVKQAFYDYWGDSIPVRSNGYKVFKRWEWRVTQNMLPDGTVVWPQEQLSDFIGMVGKPQSGGVTKGVSGGNNYGAPCAQGGRWSPVGPVRNPYNQTSQPTGIGRVAGIAFHPSDSNTIFVCAPQGGLWKSTDNGKNWNQLFGKGPVVNTIGVNSLLLSYNNPDTMYMGTGDRDAGDAPGFGVLASWDGGKTWVVRNSGMGNRRVGRMVMHPSNSSIMLASTDAGIYRTTNGGATWTLTLSGGAWDVLFKPTDPSIAYAVINANFYRSTDNGSTWSLITSGLPTSGIQRGMIAVTNADAAYVYMIISNSSSGYYGVYRSTNSGVDFTAMSTTPNILGYSETGAGSGGQGWYDLDIAADPFNKNTIYAYGINVWKSTNGGSNWTINAHWVGSGGADDVHADQHAGEFSNSGRRLYAGNDGGIYFTTNGGTNWTNISNGIQNSQIYRLSQAQTNEFAGAQGYQDNGSSQTQQDEFYTYYGGDGMDCQTDPTDHNYMYGSYVFGVIYRSIDKTTNRTIAQNGTNNINEGGDWLTPFVLQEGNPSRMFAGYTNVWRCDNVKSGGAISWTRISSGFSGSVRQLENSPALNSVLYTINGSGQLWRSTDATAVSPTFTNLSSTQPSGIRYVEAHHKFANTVFACNASNLYRSTNQGASWTSIAVLPSGSGNMNCLFIDSSNKTERIYIGSEKGVFVWDSVTATVYTFNTGFPVWADVTDLAIYYSPKGRSFSKIVASTYGMGVWRSNLFEDGTLAPKAGFFAFDSVFVTGGVLRLYENIQNGASAVKWTITPKGYKYIEGTDSLSLNPVIQLGAKGLYTVKLTASNCQGADSITKKSWIRSYLPASAAGCKNTTNYQTSNYAIGVLRVNLTDNYSETGTYFDDGEYYDRSDNKVFRLVPNTAYTVTLKTGLYNSEFTRLYFDYDNNGKFENYKGEVSTAPASTLGTRTISFTTPASLKPNRGIRMRVLSDFYAIDTNACRNLGYGQGEDYTLIYDKPIPFFTANKTGACIGETVIFMDSTDGLADAWSWNFGAGASPATATGVGPHSVTYSTTGLKSVRLMINGKDSIRKNNYIRIDAKPQPLVRIKSGTLSGCEARNITLAVSSLNGTPYTVQWQKNGSDLVGKTDTILSLTNVKTIDAGTYSAKLINNKCTVQGNNIAIVVNPNPVSNFTINNAAQCFNYHQFSFTNSSTISSGTISTFSWNFGDNKTASTANATHQYMGIGNYTVKLVNTSNQGCKDSISLPVSLYPNAKLKFTINDSDQCYKGNNFIFTNSSNIVSGSIASLWHFGDGNTSSIYSPTKSFSASGTFKISLYTTSDKGCLDTLNSSVRVYSNPTAQFSTSPTSQCLKGNKFSFSNFTTNTDGTLSFKWNFGDGNNSTQSNPIYTYSSSGNYNVKLLATTSYGCLDSINKPFTVNPQAAISVKVNDSDQCQSGNLFVFNNNSTISNGSLSYTWNFGNSTSSTVKSPSVSYLFPGIYPVTLWIQTSSGCKDTFETKIRVYSQPAVDFSIKDAIQCLRKNEFSFSNLSVVSDATFNSFWDFKNGKTANTKDAKHSFTTAADYAVKLRITSAFGCRDSMEKTITVWPQAQVKFSINDSQQCFKNNQYIFTNNSSIARGSINSSTWFFGDGNSSALKTPVYQYNAFGKYPVKLVVNSNNICSDTLIKWVQVYAQPVAAFTISPSATLCFKYHQLKNSINSTITDGTLTSTLDYDDGFQTSASNSQHTYSSAGNYSLLLISTSNFGCKDSLRKPVTIHASPKPTFDISRNILCEGDSVLFTNKTTISSGSYSSNWILGAGKTDSRLNPKVAYNTFGNYDISLIANSDQNCKDTAIQSIKVASLPTAKFEILPKNGCANQTAFIFNSLSSNADGTSMTNIWNFGDSSKDTGNSVKHLFKSSGNYFITLETKSAVCSSQLTEQHIVAPAVSAAFVIAEINKENRLFTALDSNQPTYNYQWKFGDGDTGSGDKIKHTFLANSNYTTQLIVSNNFGCTDTSKMSTTILSPNYKYQDNKLNFYVYPNPTDGKFTYKFEIKEQRSVEVSLYDILGQKPIYTKLWEEQPSGIYFETIDMKTLGVSAGTYPLKIKSENASLIVKIIYTSGP